VDITSLKTFLDEKVDEYNRKKFIDDDPISIPHQFTSKQDIEIAGFWTAMLAWGQRKTIINKARELFELMDNSPHEFIVNHTEKDRTRLAHFKHRTFLTPDTYYFLEFLQHYYRDHDSLEDLFVAEDMKTGLTNFSASFFSLTTEKIRTQKHVASPSRKSTCKRLNMYLRWMVRKDNRGVDFGLWKKIKPSQLYIPLDVHVARIARNLKILKRNQNDWRAVEELTEVLRKMDPDDPVKYDFALFGLGVLEKNGKLL